MRIAKKHIYLDYASTAPVDPSVERAMRPYWSVNYGNPSALHSMGIRAGNAIKTARTAIAETLAVHPDEIVFTSGGTESDNMAIIGTVMAARKYVKRPHVITTNIEHPAVLETCRAIEEQGIDVTYVEANADGIVEASAIKKALKPTTVLVSVMYANNEIGTIQPIHEIAKVVRHFRKHAARPYGTDLFTYPAFHTDAAQAMQYLLVRVPALGVDLLSFNGSKIYGPKGIGTLYKKRSLPFTPTQFGGDQEHGLRAGTENVPLIVGLGAALTLTEKMKAKESARLTKLRDYFIASLKKAFPKAIINGHRTERLPNNVNVSFPGYESDFLVIGLDARGIYVSGKSACKSGDGETSHVLIAIHGKGLSARALAEAGSVRFSLGRSTIKQDIDTTVRALMDIFIKQAKWKML